MQRAAPRLRGSRPTAPCSAGPGGPAASGSRSGCRGRPARRRARARLASAALRRSSASWRRECRPATPAASSRMRRRCSGLALTISPIWPWRTSAGERAPVAASSNRILTSRARTSRAVDAIGRAHVALDAARHLEHIAVVELGRRRAGGVVDEDRHFGRVAGGPRGGAGEDHVLHAEARMDL